MSEAAAATKAAATGDDRFIEMANLDDEVKNLTALSNAHADARSHARRVVIAADQAIPRLDAQVEKPDALLVNHHGWQPAGKRFVVIGDTFRPERPERSESLLNRVTAVYHELKGAGSQQSLPVAAIMSGIEATP